MIIEVPVDRLFFIRPKKTQNYIAIRIPGKTGEAIMEALRTFRAEYGERFSEVFKTITVGNGSEFAGFTKAEIWGLPCLLRPSIHLLGTPSERVLQRSAPGICTQGFIIGQYTDEDIPAAADELNGRPPEDAGRSYTGGTI